MSHAVNTELRTLFYAPIAPSVEPLAITVDAAASQLPTDQAEPLLRALRLQPSHGAHYHQLALLAQQHKAPHETRAALLERASALSPSDTGLKFEVSNARKDHFYELHTGSAESGGAAALKHARKRWLASLRQVVALEEGRWSSTVNQNLGTALQLMGKYRESEEHFERALHLLGLSLKTGQARRELSEPERHDAKDTLAALDLSLAHRGKPRDAVHQLGVTMGFWTQADQRAPTSRPELLSCPFHERHHYRGLVGPLEAATAAMREEMLTLLRRRADGDEDEASLWYEDHERIAHRPAQWLRRHVSCVLPQDIAASPGTCHAVSAAMRWYYAAAAPGTGPDATIDPFFLKAQFSLLSPGAHILPHAGPTNERLAISLGLAGLETAEMRVGATWRRWEEGAALIFDDSFEHEVHNPGDDPRAVLIVHFAHPQLMPPGTNGAEMGTSCRVPEQLP